MTDGFTPPESGFTPPVQKIPLEIGDRVAVATVYTNGDGEMAAKVHKGQVAEVIDAQTVAVTLSAGTPPVMCERDDVMLLYRYQVPSNINSPVMVACVVAPKAAL